MKICSLKLLRTSEVRQNAMIVEESDTDTMMMMVISMMTGHKTMTM
jgi:hypothetical protein